jgi:hypothetical protein
MPSACPLGPKSTSRPHMKRLKSRIGGWSAFGVLFKKFDRVADGQNGLGGVIGNFTMEFFLEGHHELDGVEAVGTEVVDETRLFRNLVGLHAQVLHDDLLNSLANVTHRSDLVLFRLGHDLEQIATIAYGLVVIDLV